MTIMTFDTLKTVEILQEAGISQVQAKAISLVMRDSQDWAELVTKSDLRENKLENKADFEKLEMRMDAKFAEMSAKNNAQFAEIKADMNKMMLQITVRLGGLVSAGIVILIALIEFS